MDFEPGPGVLYEEDGRRDAVGLRDDFLKRFPDGQHLARLVRMVENRERTDFSGPFQVVADFARPQCDTVIGLGEDGQDLLVQPVEAVQRRAHSHFAAFARGARQERHVADVDAGELVIQLRNPDGNLHDLL